MTNPQNLTTMKTTEIYTHDLDQSCPHCGNDVFALSADPNGYYDQDIVGCYGCGINGTISYDGEAPALILWEEEYENN